MDRRRMGEGSWIAWGYRPERVQLWLSPFYVFDQVGDGNVVRYVDRSYQARVR
jgi:hypothetical protein